MASKRDQLQSYQFLVQRMVSALVIRETDPEQTPFRRARATGIGSIALALLVIAGFWVFGLIVPGGNKAWKDGDVVVVEKETGTRFVYLDGRLHPTMNFTSALLAIGDNVKTKSVSRKSIAGVPRGPRIGIPDAPDSLPDRKRLLSGSWSLCSQPATDEAGAPTTESVLMVGQQPPGGRPAGDAAMMVEVGRGGDQYLIWRGYRHRIQRADTAVVALAVGAQPWATVGPTFVDTLPAGDPIAPIRSADTGKRSRAIPGRNALVGQLYVVQGTGGGTQHYLAEIDALRPISALQFDVQRSTPSVAKAYGGRPPYAIPLDPTVAANAIRLPGVSQSDPAELPYSRPEFVGPRAGEGVVCATYGSDSMTPELLVDPGMPQRDPMTVTPRTSRTGTALADRIVVPPGRAAVVETMPTGTAPRGTVSIVTDAGRSYPLADPGLLDVLGYGGVTPVKLPAWLVARLPQGSGLDPLAAMNQA